MIPPASDERMLGRRQDPSQITSNTFTMEWPPKSGRQMEFPEADRADFFDLERARKKVNPGQVPLLDELEELVFSRGQDERQ